MAQIIGNVKAIEAGKFFLKDPQGHVNVLKVGDVIHEGEQVGGAQTNAKDATIIIDVILAGAGDLVISGNGELQFDATLLAGVFSHHDEVVYVNSVKEAMAMAGLAEGEKLATEDQVQKGDVTAAGDVLTDTEREGDVFAARTGQITDVTTDLRDTSANVAEITIAPDEVTLLVPLEGEAPVPPVPLVEVATAPILDVTLGEGQFIENGVTIDNPKVFYSSIGAGISYSEDGSLILVDGKVVSADSEVAYNPGNGYGVTTVGEHVNFGAKEIDTGTAGSEALVINLDEEAASLSVMLKHTKQDPDYAKWEAYDSEGTLVGSGTAPMPGHDAVTSVTITPTVEGDTIQYVVFLGTENGYYVQGVESATFGGDYYQYPLDIIVADLAPGETSDILGDVIVTGLPEGAILSHPGYDSIYVTGSEEEIHFSSDTDPFSWTMTLNEALSDDTSIVASLTSTEPGDGSAMAVVGVYGDNDIIGGAGADQLDGRDGNDTLSGRAGDDTLIGGEGNDSLYGEDGNDTLLFDSNDSIIDGGLGTDTLILTGSTNIDFATWNSDSLRSIEVIDLTDGDHDLINLSNADILNMSSGNNEIYILGDSLDKVDFLDSENWKLGTIPVIETINGTEHTFDVYTNADDPTVTVRVEQVIDTI